MMGTIWLACCTCDAYARIQREVEARDAGARILRVESTSMLAEMARAFARSEVPVSAIVGAPSAQELVAAVAAARGEGAIRQVVAVAHQVDAGLAAQLFQAGATEVIAGAEALPRHNGGEVRAETGRTEGAGARQGTCGDTDPGARHETVGPAPQSSEVPHEAAPREGGWGDGPADDLDEPERTTVVERSESAPAPVFARPVKSAPGTAGPAVRGAGKVAPLIALVSGRGGCGKTTLAAAIALRASELGLKCAVLDLDLMFGNLYTLLGVDEPRDAATLVAPSRRGALSEAEVVQASMRVAPGLTLWGPVRAPEQAELMGDAMERLLEVVRREADLIVVDTAVSWGDAAAAAVAACDRCLVVGDARVGAVASAERVIGLAGRIGVSRTKMASVFNRFSAKDGGEDAATRFEFSTALGLKARIDDGGSELEGLAAVGHLDEALAKPGSFRTSVCLFADRMLRELGCAVPEHGPAAVRRDEGRPRIRLPWSRGGGGLS